MSANSTFKHISVTAEPEEDEVIFAGVQPGSLEPAREAELASAPAAVATAVGSNPAAKVTDASVAATAEQDSAVATAAQASIAATAAQAPVAASAIAQVPVAATAVESAPVPEARSKSAGKVVASGTRTAGKQAADEYRDPTLDDLKAEPMSTTQKVVIVAAVVLIVVAVAYYLLFMG